ncbi:unnamed protein product [Schistosoma margrebowiei]|uniref:Uncharacterized protein n=1 Tax=Schistosoma margrebowiei TaxID=48269 RepID=A0A183M1G6_9TREM|nr:unnamed protein product [Schistosoma margrebowiei]
MVVGGSQQETLDPCFVLLGTRQQGVPVILRELVLPDGELLIYENEIHNKNDIFYVKVYSFHVSLEIYFN